MTQSEGGCGICGSSNYDIEGAATVLVRDRHRDGEIVEEYDSEEMGRCNSCGATYYRPPWYHMRVPKPPVPIGWWESPEQEYSNDSPMRGILRTQQCEPSMQQVTFKHEPKPVNVTLAGRVDHYADRTEYGLLPYLPIWATDGASILVIRRGRARIEIICQPVSGDYADEPYENEVDLDIDDVFSVLASVGYPLPQSV